MYVFWDPRRTTAPADIPAPASSNSSKSQSPTPVFRCILLGLANATVLAHIFVIAALGHDPGTRLLSNMLQVVLGVLAIVAITDAGRRTAPSTAQVWYFAAAALTAYTMGQIVFTYYDSVVNAPFLTPWISDQLFFFWPAPLIFLIALEYVNGPRNCDWNLILDLGQLVVLAVALHLLFFGD